MMKMIKKLFTLMICMFLFLSLTGCDAVNDFFAGTEYEVIPTTVPVDSTLSEEAQKIYQFKLPKQGDTVVDITIKGYGVISVKLFPTECPKAVENFTVLAANHYYDGVTFHRVIADFMMQAGDPSGTGKGGGSIYGTPFEDEFSDTLHPYRGALCMANSGADTNGSQFFLVQANSATVQETIYLLDEQYNMSYADYLKEGYGVTIDEETESRYETYGGTPWLEKKHTVFGQMYEGFEVLDAICAVATDPNTYMPKTQVVIESISIHKYGE